MSAPSTPPSTNHAPRASAWLGFILFLVGLAMIYSVFAYAKTLLAAPPPTVPPVVGTDPNGLTNISGALGKSMTDLVQKLLILLVMCIVGSVFSSQGINLLFAAWNAKHTPPAP